MHEERRRFNRLNLKALVLTSFGIYFTEDVSAGGISIIGPTDAMDRLNVIDTIDFYICTVPGKPTPKAVSMYCRGDVVSISKRTPSLTRVSVRFIEAPDVY